MGKRSPLFVQKVIKSRRISEETLPFYVLLSIENLSTKILVSFMENSFWKVAFWTHWNCRLKKFQLIAFFTVGISALLIGNTSVAHLGEIGVTMCGRKARLKSTLPWCDPWGPEYWSSLLKRYLSQQISEASESPLSSADQRWLRSCARRAEAGANPYSEVAAEPACCLRGW